VIGPNLDPRPEPHRQLVQHRKRDPFLHPRSDPHRISNLTLTQVPVIAHKFFETDLPFGLVTFKARRVRVRVDGLSLRTRHFQGA
jgi:hypothetical protein